MKSIRSNFIYNTILNVCNVIFPLITAPYIARVLEPDGVGLFSFANTYAGYFAMVAVLGIPTYGIRSVAKVREDKNKLEDLLSELMTLSLLSTMIVTAVYVSSLVVIHRLRINYIIFLIAGLSLYFAPIKINWFYQGIEDFSYITLRSLFVRTLSIIAIFVFVKTKSDLIIYILIYALGSVVGDIWNYLRLLSQGIKPRIKFLGLKSHLRPVLILFISSVAISIYTILDTIMLGFMSDYSQVGYYNNASHLSKTVLAVVTSLAAVAIPRVSNYHENGMFEEINKLIDKSFSVVSFMAIPATVGLACIAPVFVPLFYGNGFLGTVIPLRILSLIIIAIGFSNLLGMQVLVGLGKDSLLLYSVIVGAVINFIFNVLLIPKLGAVGASVSSVIAEFAVLVVEYYLVRKYTFVQIKCNRDFWFSLLFSLLFIPIVGFLGSFISGWTFILVAVSSCVLFYGICQFWARNTTFQLLLESIRSRKIF